MFMRHKRTRLALGLAATTCLALSVVVPISTTVAGATSNTQPNGCASNIPPGGMTQINMGLAGVPVPSIVTPPTPIVLTGVVVTFAVSQSLLAAGIAVGVVTAAPDLPNLGNAQINNPPDGLTTPNGNAGILAAAVAAGGGKLIVKGGNTVESVQTATNTVAITTTFYVTADVNDGSNVQIYSAVTSPPPGGAIPNGVVPGRTGTLVAGDLLIPLSLAGHLAGSPGAGAPIAGGTSWTPVASAPVTFAEHDAPLPSSVTFPTAGDKAVAPLRINTTLNGLISVQFSCWPGTVTPAAPTPPPDATYVHTTPVLFAQANPPTSCHLGTGIPAPPKPNKNSGLAKISKGLLPADAVKDTKWKNTGTLESCTGAMPNNPKNAQPITGGSIQLQVTVAPGSDCTDIIGGAVTKNSLSIKWNQVVSGKLKSVSSDKFKSGISFTRTSAPGVFPIVIDSNTGIVPVDPKSKSLFQGRSFSIHMVMDQTAGDIAAACPGPKGKGVTQLTFRDCRGVAHGHQRIST